jgi:hypothetical protein
MMGRPNTYIQGAIKAGVICILAQQSIGDIATLAQKVVDIRVQKKKMTGGS